MVNFYDNAVSPLNQINTNPNLGATAGNGGAGVGGGSRTQLVDFLTNGLTDCRVEHELAPFDHPALALPNGPTLLARGAAGNGTACP